MRFDDREQRAVDLEVEPREGRIAALTGIGARPAFSQSLEFGEKLRRL
jgi:hypothetical protein